jgi:hypothetical protein
MIEFMPTDQKVEGLNPSGVTKKDRGILFLFFYVLYEGNPQLEFWSQKEEAVHFGQPLLNW